MSVFPELDSLSLTGLQDRFRAPPPDDPDLDDYLMWYEEVAIAIRERDPDEGARFLREEVAGADSDRLISILLAITWFGEHDRAHEDLLVECLQHPDEHVVAQAIDGLARLGGCGLAERILALGADSRPWIRGSVLRYGREIAPDQAPALLLDALTDPHYIVRWNAVDELEELGYTPALARIEALCADPDPNVRQAAVSAIRNLGGPDRAVPLLLDALDDPHHLVRENAVRELSELDYASALPQIEALCADPHPDVRHETLAAIVKLAAPEIAIPLLVGGLADPDATVRFHALNHLDRLEQFNDRATFERMLDDPDEDVRESARSILDKRSDAPTGPGGN